MKTIQESRKQAILLRVNISFNDNTPQFCIKTESRGAYLSFYVLSNCGLVLDLIFTDRWGINCKTYEDLLNEK